MLLEISLSLGAVIMTLNLAAIIALIGVLIGLILQGGGQPLALSNGGTMSPGFCGLSPDRQHGLIRLAAEITNVLGVKHG